MKTMKMSEWLEFTQPRYLFLRLTPSFSVRNYNSDNFISLIGRLYVSMNDRINTINKKLIIEGSAKLGYYIYMEKTKVEFYFVVPEKHFNLFKDKIIDTWANRITITNIESIPNFSPTCTGYFMAYKKNDALSLTCDKRNNTLLTRQLNTLHIMDAGDKVGVFYNFMPMYQKNWKPTYDHAIKDMRDGNPPIRCKSLLGAVALKLLHMSLRIIDMGLDIITFQDNENHKKPLKDLEDYGTASKAKREKIIAKCQILCFSESKDKKRERESAIAMCDAFECLNEDNILDYGKVKDMSKVNLLDSKINGVPVMKISPGEGQNMISLPGRENLEAFPLIDRTEVLECDTPAELRDGVICIGHNKYLDNIIKSYLPTDYRRRCWALVILGPTRAGKSNLIANISRDALSGGECIILFDFCGNTELSDAVCLAINKNKVLNIDCSDYKKLQGMGYNEVPDCCDDPMKQYENAKIKTSQLETLIDSVNDSDRDLKAKMSKFLKAAALVVFINNGSINDVFKVLLHHKMRYQYIKAVPENQMENMEDKIEVLNELDDWKGGVVVGTHINTAIAGIMDRLENLKTNTYMELMLKKDCSNNVNLLEEIQKNQVICLRMPEHLFSSQSEKDAFCTYWMTKIWLAVKFRNTYIPKEKHVKVNLIIDELSQVEHCETFVKSILSQMAKFNCKSILSAHYLDQIKILRGELRSANASYLMVSGCDKSNYEELKEEAYPFTVDDLLHLKEFHSLNLVKLGDGYANFITALPPKLY